MTGDARPSSHRISELTRRNLFDALTLQSTAWAGRLEETQFLGRIFDLTQMPSTDHRHKTAAGDIQRHRVANPDDWPDNWVFHDDRFNLSGCDDETLLRFLCEMLHPVVRSDTAEVESLRTLINKHLAPDGYQLMEMSRISGYPVFTATLLLDGPPPSVELARDAVEPLNASYVSQQITRMAAAIPGDTELAIGTAKEFVETVCKAILHERGVTVPDNPKFPALVRMTAQALQLLPDDVPESAKAAETIKRLLQNLGQVTQGLAELRGPYGTGHGKHPSHAGLRPRHAKLAVGAATTLALFLFETHREKPVKAGR